MTEAEDLFRNFARRHSLIIEKISDPEFDLLMCVPRQPGLSFEITLGLQNSDEINIGFEEFWSYFFPFETTKKTVSDLLDALVLGDCRLAIHTRRGRTVKRVLELRTDGGWQPVYTEYPSIQLPFLGATKTYFSNEDAGRE